MIDITKYNNENIFAKILRGEIPCDKILDNKDVLVFKDINPQAPLHILIIPKKKYCSLNDFSKNADPLTIASIFRAIDQVINSLGIKNGFRLICNTGEDGCQEVPHLHFHILAGKKLGKIISD